MEQGDKTSWQVPQVTGGEEQTIEHALSGSGGLRYRLPRSLFASLGLEISYLASARITGSKWLGTSTLAFEDNYAKESDRWNAVARAGVGGTGTWREERVRNLPLRSWNSSWDLCGNPSCRLADVILVAGRGAPPREVG